MPTLPHPMADLPPKPVTTAYEHDARRDMSRRQNRSAPMGWSGASSTAMSSSMSGPSSSYSSYDDRRSRYQSRSYNGSSTSLGGSSTNGHGGFNLSTGQPSPSSSVTSTASSLRTPPDLLLNGTTIVTGLGGAAFGGQKGMTRLDDKNPASFTPRAVNLTVKQLEHRLQLLSELSLSDESMSPALPTPPSSPKTRSRPINEGKKRKADYSSDSSDDSTNVKQAPKRRQGSRVEESKVGPTPADPQARTGSSSWQAPVLKRTWTKELYFETAVVYRQRGRELKHRGDHRRRDISTSKRHIASPEKESLIASLEQLDALLLYMYGFWCEDQACGGSCVVANWTSLYGLLKYVYDQLIKSKMPMLAGLCRLLEAVVRRHVASHEMRLVNHRLSKAISSGGATAAQSPAPTTAPSPSSSDSNQQTLAEISEAITRIVADNERSARLLQQCKQSILNFPMLQEAFPHVGRLCEGCMKNRTWNSLDATSLATLVDPSAALSSSEIAASENGWTWPLDLNTPSPLIVCFGRAILREGARQAKVSFVMEPVRMP